jgi:hypothetical protein
MARRKEEPLLLYWNDKQVIPDEPTHAESANDERRAGQDPQAGGEPFARAPTP